MKESMIYILDVTE